MTGGFCGVRRGFLILLFKRTLADPGLCAGMSLQSPPIGYLSAPVAFERRTLRIPDTQRVRNHR